MAQEFLHRGLSPGLNLFPSTDTGSTCGLGVLYYTTVFSLSPASSLILANLAFSLSGYCILP